MLACTFVGVTLFASNIGSEFSQWVAVRYISTMQEL